MTIRYFDENNILRIINNVNQICFIKKRTIALITFNNYLLVKEIPIIFINSIINN